MSFTASQLASRYQCQRWHVRWCRWLRHMPLAYLRASWALSRWIYDGSPVDYADDGWTRGEMRDCIVSAHVSAGEIAMGHWYTFDECD